MKKANERKQITLRMPTGVAARLDVTAMRAPGEDLTNLIIRILDKHLTLVEKYGEDVATGVIERFSN